MVDEKIVDYGTFIGGAILGAVLYYTPQIQALAGDSPLNQLIIGIAMMALSQIGSRFAINMVKAPSIPAAPQEGA